MKAVLITIASLLLLAIIVVGGWQLGWWMKSYSTSRNARIYQQSYGAQSANINEVESLIVTAKGISVQLADPNTPASETSALKAQQVAVTNEICSRALTITPPLPSTEAAFVAAHC